MSVYERIAQDIEMKDLIIAINHRFDQVYKKINILDEKVDALDKRFDSLEEKLDEKLDKLAELIKDLKK